MSDKTQTEPKSTLFGILTRAAEPKVLMQPDGSSFQLPSFTMNREMWQTGVARAAEGFREILGDKINVLYRASFVEDASSDTSESVFVIEDLSASSKVSNGNGIWLDEQEMKQIALIRPEQRSIILEVLEQLSTGLIPSGRPPWARYGWYLEAREWIEKMLEKQGLVLTGSITPVRSWSVSCVYRVPTSGGDYYFKSVAELPLFVNEPEVLAELVRFFPGQSPAGIAANPERWWVLMEDLGEPLGWAAPMDKRMEMLRQFAQLQQASVKYTDELLKIGCLDRRLRNLEEAFNKTANSPEVNEALNENELVSIARFGTRIPELIERLKAFNVPETLVHGDLHGGNVANGEDQLVFFDWTDACIAYPFFDMLDIFMEKEVQVKSTLMNHYLAQWLDYEPMERLNEAWKTASILAAVHHAVSYQTIVANIEPAARHELDWGVAFWMRRILELLDKQNESDD